MFSGETLSLKKAHRKTASERVISQKRGAFSDFVSFIHATYPETVVLADVTPAMAEEYISMLRQEGRFNKSVTFIRNGQKITRPAGDTPSARTANLYLSVCKEVFSLLSRDAGIVENPFEIVKAGKDEETREAFTEAELKKIYDNLDEFTRPLFTIAITTALREGDICTLKWSDIDFDLKVIRRQMNKTGKMVEIPITRDLMIYLEELKEKAGESPYVLPEHAQMYLKNRTGITYRVKLFLERLGIQTTRVPKGRTRAVSVKDLHSCRHTFCYYAGLNGIPLAVVQSIVGHMTSEMTRHYSAHATLEDKRKGMDAMPDFMRLPSVQQQKQLATAISVEPEREQLKKLAETLPIITIREILADERCKKALEK